jgi:hypothetical protein
MLFKHKANEADKPETSLHDQDGNTKPERNTGTAAEYDTQL